MRRGVLSAAAITGTAGLLAGGLAYAALYPTSQIFGRVVIAGDDTRELALTYDDGPNPAVTPVLLELFHRRQVRATFFLIGRFVKQEPALAREIAGAGHLIGSHTMTHPRLMWQTGDRIRQELRDTSNLLEDVLGSRVEYVRPPHGARRPYVMRAARELGMATVMWNVTAQDWKPIGAEAIFANVSSGIGRNQRRGRGSNILLHDGGHLGLGADRSATVRVTEQVLARYAVGSFVTVDAWDERA